MKTRWNEWLAVEQAAGRGGVVLAQPSIVRGQAYTVGFDFPADLTGAAVAATLHADPDDAPLASFAVTVGAYNSVTGSTLVTLSLDAAALDTELPADADFDGVTEVIFKLNWTPAGETTPVRLMGLVIPVAE